MCVAVLPRIARIWKFGVVLEGSLVFVISCSEESACLSYVRFTAVRARESVDTRACVKGSRGCGFGVRWRNKLLLVL
jgi:hypothetical protein